MAQLRGVIFDVDGTLVNSNDAHASAWVDAFAEFGYTVDFAEVRKRIGMGGDILLPDLMGMSDKENPGKKIASRRSEIFKEKYLPKLEGFGGSRELIQKLQEQGFQVAVASSAKEEELEPLLKLAGAEKLIEQQKKTSSDDAESSKPEPDIIHAALDKLGLRPEECVMVGDTPYDIEAATKAGVATLAVRSGGWSDEGLKGARWIFDGPQDLLDKFPQTPFASTAGVQ
jgi:phosphoglycolate phosphatase-like HAD superfamily hydrolase